MGTEVLKYFSGVNISRLLKKMGWQTEDYLNFFPFGIFSMISVVNTIPLFKNKEFLPQKYVVKKLTCEEIAKEIVSARTTVLKHLKLYNIPVREVGSNQTRKRGLAYGSICVKKNELDHKREIENISKMRELRDKGFSYHKIAAIFNSMKIPTKTRKGQWHSKTIYQILSRLMEF